VDIKKLAFGDFEFDPATSDLRRGSGVVPLTPKALAVLGYLVSRPRRLVSKQELLDALWPDVFVGDGVLKVCVRELRRVLDDDARAPRFIETAHRRGYRFIAPVRELGDPPASTVAANPVHTVTGDHGRVRRAERRCQYRLSGARQRPHRSGVRHGLGLASGDLERAVLRALPAASARFSRLILLDKRGTGLPDPVAQMPTLEQRMDDVRAVMDAVGSRRAVLLGVSEGGPMCSLFGHT
jgi:DNA-binding winged helix-turn-helix (wHTH) protein